MQPTSVRNAIDAVSNDAYLDLNCNCSRTSAILVRFGWHQALYICNPTLHELQLLQSISQLLCDRSAEIDLQSCKFGQPTTFL